MVPLFMLLSGVFSFHFVLAFYAFPDRFIRCRKYLKLDLIQRTIKFISARMNKI